jgi:hypothetical protein
MTRILIKPAATSWTDRAASGGFKCPRSADLGVVVAPAAAAADATPTLLAPHQPSGPTEHRQINEHDLANTVSMHPTATRTRSPLALTRDHDPQPQRPLINTDHGDLGQANEQRAHALRIDLQL